MSIFLRQMEAIVCILTTGNSKVYLLLQVKQKLNSLAILLVPTGRTTASFILQWTVVLTFTNSISHYDHENWISDRTTNFCNLNWADPSKSVV